MMTFCTLFNVNYLDKGLALYDSLESTCPEFTLYILCMDSKCYEVLHKLDKKRIVPIRLEDFETQELLSVKNKRKLGEYYWTCSSWIISYVLEKYAPEYCTYVDADLYFYSDPSVIIQEMKSLNASVQVVSHHFINLLEKSASDIVGKYCVEFDTFKNDDKGKFLLDIWKKQVIDHCSIDGDGIYWGDQKYQDNWVEDYDFVIETNHVGAGVAPWNLSQYKVCKDKNKIIVKRGAKKGLLLFYHFENIQYIDESTANASLVIALGLRKKIVDMLYVPYLQHLRQIKEMLKTKYDIDILLKKHPGVQEEVEQVNNYRVSEKLRHIIDVLLFRRSLWYAIKYRLVITIPKRFLHKFSIIKF